VSARAELSHVRWIGGGSGAGKSTVAAELARRHGVALYHVDPPSQYIGRTTRESAPLLHDFAAMTVDERWVERSPREMMETFHAFQGESFDLVLEDLRGGPPGPVIVEGFSLLPRLVMPLLADALHAIWLLPTPAFRRTAFDARGSTWSIAGRTSDPVRALENLLARDALFTDGLRREAAEWGGRTLDVDGTLTIEQTVEQVGRSLGFV
jgi:hypothetical protein